MSENYKSLSEDGWRTAEEEKVLEWSRIEENRIKTDLKTKDTNYRRGIRMISFHRETSNIPAKWRNIILRLREKFKDDESIEWAIFNNLQIQKLLANIVSEQAEQYEKQKSERAELEESQTSNWKTSDDLSESDNEEVGSDTAISEQSDNNQAESDDVEVEPIEDYIFRNSSPENFEDFLLSDTGIAVLSKELRRHINPTTWEIYANYPISENIIKFKLKKAWNSKMYTDYNLDNGFPDDDKEKDGFYRISNVIANDVDDIVWEFLKSWWSDFDENLIKNLESLLNKEKSGYESIAKLLSDQTNQDNFKELLRNNITNFSSIVKKDGKVSLETWDKQLDLQLKSYLFLYWKFFYPGIFRTNSNKYYYNQVLPKIMEAILVTDGDEQLKNIVKNNEFLEKEKKAEEERKRRNKQKRQEVAKRNRENNRSYNLGKKWKWGNINVWNTFHGDVNWAKWSEIASRVNLSDFEVDNWNLENYAESWHAKQIAFWIAWKKFKESKNEIIDIITPNDMRKLYNTETNSIDTDARNEFLGSDIMRWRSQAEINRIYSILKTFPNEFSDALKTIVSWIHNQEKRIDERVRNQALWSVIDNVRFIFADIVERWKWNSKFEWFRFDWSEPIKRVWNDIIISGTFNWTDIKIRYDLISWGLFMNSFLQYPSPSKITIWKNTNADLQIWQLESFDTILKVNYRAPSISINKNSQAQNKQNQNSKVQESWADWWINQWWNLWEVDGTKTDSSIGSSSLIGDNTADGKPTQTESSGDISTKPASNPQVIQQSTENWTKNTWELKAIRDKYREMFNANFDMISNAIVDNTKKQSAKNSVITKFMKTFNIILDGQEERKIDFNNWSNIFDFIQIIDNSNSDTLNQFQIFMEKVMKYSWLIRGKNNLQWAREDQAEEKNNKYSLLLKNKAREFSTDIESFKGKVNFESDSQLWFAQIIIDNITNGASKPDWKLDSSKMDDFMKHLETDGDNN